MNLHSAPIFSFLVVLFHTVTVTSRREGRGWKPSWDNDWGGSKSSKTAQPTFYPTLSPTSSKSSKSSWGAWSHHDDNDDWKGRRGGGHNKKKEKMKKDHHARQTGHRYHGTGRDLADEMERGANLKAEIKENLSTEEFVVN